MDIRLATTEEELDAIYRFRYKIYVEEMNRKQKYADHSSKKIVDPLDEGSFVIGAWDKNHVIGTVRSSVPTRVELGEYRDYYRLPSGEDGKISVTTRLMIHPDFRRGPLAIRLAQAIFQVGLEQAVATDYIDCNDHLLPFFTRLGYRAHRSDLLHPEYGAVTVLKLSLFDLEYFREIESPFHAILEQWNAKPSLVSE